MRRHGAPAGAHQGGGSVAGFADRFRQFCRNLSSAFRACLWRRQLPLPRLFLQHRQQPHGEHGRDAPYDGGYPASLTHYRPAAHGYRHQPCIGSRSQPPARRRNIGEDQRVALAESIRERRSRAAAIKQRQDAGKRGGRGKKKTGSDNVTNPVSDAPKTDTRAAVAREYKVPERKLRKMQPRHAPHRTGHTGYEHTPTPGAARTNPVTTDTPTGIPATGHRTITRRSSCVV